MPSFIFQVLLVVLGSYIVNVIYWAFMRYISPIKPIRIYLPKSEYKGLQELVKEQELSESKVLIGGLRLYQAQYKGYITVVDNNPSPGCGIIE